MSHTIASQPLERPRQVLILAFLAVSIWYLSWRPDTINPEAPFFSWLIYGAELYGFLTAVLHIFMCWRLSERRSPAAPPGLSVDVLVPTYNEPVDLLRKTLLAARAMEYPHRTWLLDDGRRAEMKALAEELGCGYIARPDNQHAKAGNLNHALAHTSGDFVAVFDADHAPRRDFLVKTLGYFTDEKVGFVQTPQDYFNLDSFQHRRSRSGDGFWTEQSLFFRVIQRGKDTWNAAFFCGSCAVIRRSALSRIGGFATGTVTEDLHTSIRLHAAGFRSIYHAEPLAFGLAPESVEPFIRQRVRWGQGAMHVWRKEGLLTHRGLTLAQRLNYFGSVLTYFDGWQKGIFYLAPVVVLTTSTMPLVTSAPDFLVHFVPYYLLTFWVFEEVGRGYGRTLFIEQYNMARFAAFAWATLAWILPNAKFRVTPKGSASRRAAPFTVAQWGVLVFNLAAIPVGLYFYGRSRGLPLDGLVANVMWASVNGGLALAVLVFTAAVQKHQRARYRFPVPLPAELQIQGVRVRGTADDISDNGIRFYGRLPPGIARGNHFTGRLTLPGATIEFSGEVRTLLPLEDHQGVIRAVGCSINPRKEDRDPLERFLFGSDLQWAINGYTDQAPTLLSRLLPGQVPRPRRHPFSRLRWNAGEVRGAHLDPSAPVLVSAPAQATGPRWIVSFEPLPDDADLELDVFRRMQTGKALVRLERVPAERSLGEHTFVYRLARADWAVADLPDLGGPRREAA